MGCTKVSPACDHCYAERDTKRFGRVEWGAGKPRVRTSAANWKLPRRWNEDDFCECRRCGVRNPRRLLEGLHCVDDLDHDVAPARRRVFCASLADVFDNEVDPAWRADLFKLIHSTPALDWLLLTKRVGNARQMMLDALAGLSHEWPLPNVWLGATVVTQEEVDRDIPKLLAVPARVRFLSVEPMLGPIDMNAWLTGPNEVADGYPRTVDWVICGGESGPNARPMHPDWVRSLRDQCAAAGVAFHLKQWGEWAPEQWSGVVPPGAANGTLTVSGDFSLGFHRDRSDDERLVRVGKKAAGRTLDGVEHNEFPQ